MSKARDLLRHLSDLPTRGARGGESPRRRLIQYAVAIGLTLLAWGTAVALGSEFGVATHLPFAAAVAVATWYGGIGPGLTTAALSIVAIEVSFLPPLGAIELTHPEDLIDSLVFLVVASTIGATTAALRRARLIAEQRATDLEKANVELEQQMDHVQSLSRELQASNDYLAAANAESERLGARAAKLLEVTSFLAEARTVDDVTAVILDKGTAALEAGRAFVMLVDGEHVERLGAVGYPDEMRNRARLTSVADDGLVAAAIRTRSPIWLSTVDEFRSRFPAVYQRVGVVSDRQAHAVIPLVHGGEVVGALGMTFAEPSAIGAADRTFTLLLAQASAAALQRARSYDVERDRRREAELTARGREQVLGIVAHDLRNPLHLIVATLDLLGEPGLTNEKRGELLQIASRAVTHMRRLVGDLLDAVRIQAGHLSLDFETRTLGAILEQAREMCQPMAAERGVELDVRAIDPRTTVRVDRARIQQVLGNLLGNAFKFTPPGGRVTLEARASEDEAVFNVIDTGTGIAEDRLPHIFERFWQGQPGDRGGVGLGLAITKAIVEAHGGTIGVESMLGRGSTFILRIPLGASQHDDAAWSETAGRWPATTDGPADVVIEPRASS
jgi:signal transduction histidine kinase